MEKHICINSLETTEKINYMERMVIPYIKAYYKPLQLEHCDAVSQIDKYNSVIEKKTRNIPNIQMENCRA